MPSPQPVTITLTLDRETAEILLALIAPGGSRVAAAALLLISRNRVRRRLAALRFQLIRLLKGPK